MLNNDTYNDIVAHNAAAFCVAITLGVFLLIYLKSPNSYYYLFARLSVDVNLVPIMSSREDEGPALSM